MDGFDTMWKVILEFSLKFFVLFCFSWILILLRQFKIEVLENAFQGHNLSLTGHLPWSYEFKEQNKNPFVSRKKIIGPLANVIYGNWWLGLWIFIS